MEKEEEYIRRNIAGVNSFQAKGKRKRLERLVARRGLASGYIRSALVLPEG